MNIAIMIPWFTGELRVLEHAAAVQCSYAIDQTFQEARSTSVDALIGMAASQVAEPQFVTQVLLLARPRKPTRLQAHSRLIV
jgi:hypothetical protein